MGNRKVIQVSQAAAENGYTLVALCDDGTMWHRDSLWSTDSEWRQIPGVPLPTPAPAEGAVTEDEVERLARELAASHHIGYGDDRWDDLKDWLRNRWLNTTRAALTAARTTEGATDE